MIAAEINVARPILPAASAACSRQNFRMPNNEDNLDLAMTSEDVTYEPNELAEEELAEIVGGIDGTHNLN